MQTERSTLLERIMQHQNSSYVVIDMDLIFKDDIYQLCMRDGNLLDNKSTCVDSISSLARISRIEFNKRFFKDQTYDKFLRLLRALKEQELFVVLTSTKLPKTILKAFLSIVRNTTGDILRQLLRDDDDRRLVQDSNPESLNANKCRREGYSFLDKYIVAPDYLWFKPYDLALDHIKKTFLDMISEHIYNLSTSNPKLVGLTHITTLFVTEFAMKVTIPRINGVGIEIQPIITSQL